MSFPRYPEYKESGVAWLGEIPSHWDPTRLKWVVEPKRPITYGIVQAGPNIPEGIPYIRPADMTDESGVADFDSMLRTSEEIALAYTRSSIQRGDLVCSIGPSFGKVMVTPPELEGANLTQGTARVAISSKNDPRFYFWCLRSAVAYYQWEASVGGATFRALNLGPLAATDLPNPPINEQSAIAAFLDRETAKIDALVAEQEKLVDLLKEKRQAVISHAVTKGLDPNVPMKDSGVEWLGSVPEHWEVISLKRLWDIIDCKHVTAEFVEEGFPLASIREVQSHFVNLECAKLTTDFFYTLMIEGGRDPRPGDLIFSRNATVGEVAQVADWHPSFAMGQDVCLLRKQDPKSSTDYFQAVLKSKVAQDQLAVLMIGSTFKRINVEEIRNLTVPMPPIEEQAIIANWLKENVSGLDALLRESQHAIDLLKERRAALISAAVTGKIDVRTLHPELTEAA